MFMSFLLHAPNSKRGGLFIKLILPLLFIFFPQPLPPSLPPSSPSTAWSGGSLDVIDLLVRAHDISMNKNVTQNSTVCDREQIQGINSSHNIQKLERVQFLGKL